MTDFNINLNARPYANTIDHGYNEAGEVYDIEVLSGLVLFAWDDHCEEKGYDWSDASAAFIEWCNANNVHYYARPRESFSEREALDEAARKCARYLLMEDLS